MRIINFVFHPDLQESRVNNIWKRQLEESGKFSISRDMYGEYPDCNIGVEKEQQLLLGHDRIAFQFPSLLALSAATAQKMDG